VVVGSALVKQIAEHQDDQQVMNKKVSDILSDMRHMMDNA